MATKVKATTNFVVAPQRGDVGGRVSSIE